MRPLNEIRRDAEEAHLTGSLGKTSYSLLFDVPSLCAEVERLREQLELDAREFKQRESMWIARIRGWETLAREKNWGYVHDERIDRMTTALQQIARLADAAEPLSVEAADIARAALAPK